MIGKAQSWIASAGNIAVLTGAGISAESGVPTFRGPGGLWRNFRAEDLATPTAFARNPLLVWEWYQWRRQLISETEPNPGHLALVALEQQAETFTLVTQNVDGLHDRAGSRHVLRIHGDVWTLRCTVCAAEWRDHRPTLPELPPHCECGGLARPAIVWFGERIPDVIWQEAERAVAASKVLLVVGTSAIVYPAANLIPLARNCGAKIIEVNIEETPASGMCDVSLRGPSARMLPQLIRME